MARVVEDAVDQGPQVVAAHALDDRQPLLVAQSRGAQQHQAGHLLRVADGELDRDLAAQAVGDEVVRRRLHELVEVVVQPLDEVIDVDRLARVDAPVQGGARRRPAGSACGRRSGAARRRGCSTSSPPAPRGR